MEQRHKRVINPLEEVGYFVSENKKKEGGMGFRNMEVFNYTLLAKQGWRLMENPNSLVARVLKAKYFPNSSFLQAKLGSSPSFLWRSILEGKKLLQMGIR